MKYILYTSVFFSLLACERESDTLGPELNDLYGDFQMLADFEASTTTVNFSANESVAFSARFSKTVDWNLEVIGANSGAVKRFTGLSKIVDNSNASWTGKTTDLPLFKQEDCIAVLTVPEENYSDTISGISITATKSNDGFVIADFENGVNPDWDVFAQTGADMSFNIVEDQTAGEGSFFYDMGGEVSWDYLIGLIHFPATAYQLPVFPLQENPDNVFFNVLLKKPEGISNEIILIRFREDENGDGVFQEASEDMYALELRDVATTWDQISVRYSDLTALVNGAPSSPAGNGVHEPDKLMQVSVLFLADPATGYSQTLMDYMIFTENGPLEP